MIRSSIGGSAGFTVLGGGAVELTIWNISELTSMPLNGVWPVTIS